MLICIEDCSAVGFEGRGEERGFFIKKGQIITDYDDQIDNGNKIVQSIVWNIKLDHLSHRLLFLKKFFKPLGEFRVNRLNELGL
jgi:hypothetical protein